MVRMVVRVEGFCVWACGSVGVGCGAVFVAFGVLFGHLLEHLEIFG